MGRLFGLFVVAWSQAPPKPLTLREETCRACYRSCPISCFAGTCGLNFGSNVNRFGTTNSCFTCDQSASVGISRTGDYAICTPEESAATDSYVKKKDPIKPPWGSSVPGDAKAAAMKAADAANRAVEAAQEAASESEKAAQAAVAKFNTAAGKTEGDKQELAEAHRLAETIRANEAEQAARAAEEARKQQEQAYTVDLTKLREQEVKTEHSEDALARAEKAAEAARANAKEAAAKAAEAAREAAEAGASAAGQAAEQAEADELAAAARAAQRRAIIAAVSAKSAADKANIAGAISTAPAQSPALLHQASVRKSVMVPDLAPAPASVDAGALGSAPGAGAVPLPPLDQLSIPDAGGPPNAAAPADIDPRLLVHLPPNAGLEAPAAPEAPAAAPAVPAPDSSMPATEVPSAQADADAGILPTLLPMPTDVNPDDEAARMANSVVASLTMDPSLQAQQAQQAPDAPASGEDLALPVSPYVTEGVAMDPSIAAQIASDPTYDTTPSGATDFSYAPPPQPPQPVLLQRRSFRQ